MAGSASEKLRNTAKSIAPLASWIYLLILLVTAIPFEIVSLDIKSDELSTFFCMKGKEKCCAEFCLAYYKYEVNYLQEWMYHVYLILPCFIWITDAIFRMKKAHQYPKIRFCELHIHKAYLLKLILLTITHSILLVVMACDFKDLELESKYNCSLTVYTAICKDEKAAEKSMMNIFCFICTIVLTLCVLVELVVFARSWKAAGQELMEQVEDRYHCKRCCLFLEKFFNVPINRIILLRHESSYSTAMSPRIEGQEEPGAFVLETPDSPSSGTPNDHGRRHPASHGAQAIVNARQHTASHGSAQGSDKAERLVNSLAAIRGSVRLFLDDDVILSRTKEVLQRDDLQINHQCSELLFRIIDDLLLYYSANKLLKAFKRARIQLLEVKTLLAVQYLKYFAVAEWVRLINMAVSVNAVRRALNSLGYKKFKRVEISNCDLEDDEVQREIDHSNLTQLVIQDCRVKNARSLINAFHWAALSSCMYFGLRKIELEDGGWRQFVTAIEMEKKKAKLLDIKDCTPCIPKDLQMRLKGCAVQLHIDETIITPSQAPLPEREFEVTFIRPATRNPGRTARRYNNI